MKIKTKVLIAIGIATAALLILPWTLVARETYKAEKIKPVVIEPVKPLISHQQETWIRALEWCESNGVETSINKVDKDGTPSYYSFQFKPGTFRYYGEKYGTQEKGLTYAEIMENMKSYEAQKIIVEKMIFDKEVKWRNEFPDCVRKLGLPPITKH